VIGARLVAIYVAPEAGAPMEARTAVDAVAGRGLEGDRYRWGVGTYSHTHRGPRDVTLIEREALELVRSAGIEVGDDETRRNLVTEGVALDDLCGVEFRVGAVRMRGLRAAEPCLYLEMLTGITGVFTALRHRGGLRAQVLEGGTLRVGDLIEPLPSQFGVVEDE
jgi:MOSC domain-containing protein YiiM